jgi:electron transfer flavoprotein alpha subunit
MKTFIIAETEAGAYGLSAGARQISQEVVLVALSEDQVRHGIADKVIKINRPAETALDDAYESVIALFEAEKPDTVFIEPTLCLKAVAGRLAARQGTSVITNVISLEGEGATNLYFGGVGLQTQKALGTVRLYTLEAKLFAECVASGTDVIEEAPYVSPSCPLIIKEMADLPKSEVNLNDAKYIVAAGRGFNAQADLGLAQEMSTKLKAELGCTRPLTETEKWFSRETYIGVSGLMLNPDVYIGLGLSGQMQHMVGINRSKVIFAINKDKNAPIFKQADYGLVGDLYKVLPEINAKL